jgi:Na+-translocating ferredoxin:NAD+ oxidoreductase subunit B
MSHNITSSCNGCTACVNICPVKAITGERKSVHTIDAGICIDCGACGRICPFQAVEDQAGATCRAIKRALWLKPVITEDKCISCGVCLEICPTGALDFDEPVDQRLHVIAYLKEPVNCIGCSFCEEACPVVAIAMAEPVPA